MTSKPCRPAGLFLLATRLNGPFVQGSVMQEAFQIAALWLGLAVLSTIIASHLRISMALVEICVGMAAAFVANQFVGPDALKANQDWLRFIASMGAVLLTFLAGAEVDPAVIRTKWKEVALVGAIGFFAPFFGCAALARFVLGWDATAQLAGRHRSVHHLD